MSGKQKMTPAEALTSLFEVIREEAIANPNFARRMLSVMGVQVTFTGNDGAAAAADPILVAAGSDYPAFREAFMTFSEKDLQAMIKNFALATPEDVKGVKKPKKPGFVDLMWDGAQRQLAEKRPRSG